MNGLTILDEIQIASPCNADWNGMTGDDRTRFCGSCSKHVYNIASMTAEAATALIVENEGRLCVRLYKRADGTVLTADCPVGLGKISAGRRIRRALAAGLVLPAMVVAGVTAKGIGDRQVEPFPTGPGTTWNDRIDWALITLGLKQRPTPPMVISGEIMGSPRLSITPSTPSTPNGVTEPACEKGEEIPLTPHPDPESRGPIR